VFLFFIFRKRRFICKEFLKHLTSGKPTGINNRSFPFLQKNIKLVTQILGDDFRVKACQALLNLMNRTIPQNFRVIPKLTMSSHFFRHALPYPGMHLTNCDIAHHEI